jgi:hypothetical protein
MLKRMLSVCLVVGVLSGISMAQERIIYETQPDELTVFLNDVAYVSDNLTVTSGANVFIALPTNIYEDTLIVRENGVEVFQYTLSSATGTRTLQIQGDPTGTGIREITLEYLARGISWTPYYRLTLGAEETTSQMSFYASILNTDFDLKETAVKLAAGRVDVYGVANGLDQGMSMNQALTNSQVDVSTASISTGNVVIQYTYDIGAITSVSGDTLYTQVFDQQLPTRRLLLWNAYTDSQASIIYKVSNQTTAPFTEGVVRNYQDGMFVGSDPIEFTPVGGEGSVTVGSVQTLRVRREESITAIDTTFFTEIDTRHDVTLTLTNFGTEPITLDVVDYYPTEAVNLATETNLTQEPGNVLRWTVTVGVGETITLNYVFDATY